MNLASVVEDLVYDKGLDRNRVLDILVEGISFGLKSKHPDLDFKVTLDHGNAGNFSIFIKKNIVENADYLEDDSSQITLKKAKLIDLGAVVGEDILIPYTEPLTRVDIIKARNYISEAIRKLEQDHIYKIFKDKVGELISGTVYRSEAFGYVVNVGEALAFLPASCAGNSADIKNGIVIKAVIRDVLPYSEKGSQVVLDRSGADYIEKLLEVEIPEIFEGVVEIVKAVRIAGYKTKIMVQSKAKNIDPVGACVGLAGSRIKPILAELGGEKIDIIPVFDDKSIMIQRALKSKGVSIDLNKIFLSLDGEAAEVCVSADQKSSVIGKNGGNVNLASRLLGIHIKILQEEAS